MKFSSKELLIKKHVQTKIAWHGTFCAACNHLVWLETMYKVVGLGRSKCGYRHYCWDCCQSKEEAFDIVFPTQVTAQDIIMRREKAKVRYLLRNLINDVHALPDGEVSPSVASAILRYSLKC